jgi:hypothetical protein
MASATADTAGKCDASFWCCCAWRELHIRGVLQVNSRHGASGIAYDIHCRSPGAAAADGATQEVALGVFTSAGVAHLQVQREADMANVSDLLRYSLDEVEVITAEKGGIRTLLGEE